MRFVYPLPIAAYLPDLPLMKKAPAIPPKTAPAITAPTTPLASRYGVPEPDDGFASACFDSSSLNLKCFL